MQNIKLIRQPIPVGDDSIIHKTNLRENFYEHV